jgi:hypothetical protein
VLPSGWVAVPFPRTSATPTNPLKSVIDDGSTPAPKESTWNVTPLIVIVAVVGLGAGCVETGAAAPAAGHSSPLPSEAPVAAAAPL